MKSGLKYLVLLLALAAAGCASHAEDQFAKLKVGMSQNEVKTSLGAPEKVRSVRFSGHDEDYLVWEYEFVPELDGF